MKKRRSENAQISKEEYNNNNNNADAAGVWEKASEETTRNRRFVSVTRPTTTATTTTTGDDSGAPNAFANVKLAAATAAAAAAPGFGGFAFGGMSSNNNKVPAPAPAPAFQGFSFGLPAKAQPTPSNTAATAVTATNKTSALVARAEVAVKDSNDNDNNIEEIKFWQDQHKDLMISVLDTMPKSGRGGGGGKVAAAVLDLSSTLKSARTISARIENKIHLKKKSFIPVTPSPSRSSTTTNTTTTTTTTTTAPAAPGTTTTMQSSSTPASPKTGTSSGEEAAAAATPPPPPASSNNNNNNSQSSPSPAAPDGFTEASDPVWDNVVTYDSIQLFCFNKNNGSWDALTRKANVRIQQSKTDANKHRMLARDEVTGRVYLNMLVSSVPSAKYQEATKTKRDNTTIVSGNIIFKGLDQERGPTQFLIKGRVDTGKSLYSKMLELGVSPGE